MKYIIKTIDTTQVKVKNKTINLTLPKTSKGPVKPPINFDSIDDVINYIKKY